jgi:mannosyltransferase OCH1-like enzyme
MSTIIIVANRLEKISGTILKIFAYPFHAFFPKKRFTIPLVSKPLISTKKDFVIPKILWQTNYTNRVSLPVYINYLFNRLMSLDFEYRYVNTEDRLEFIRANAPKRYVDAFE